MIPLHYSIAICASMFALSVLQAAKRSLWRIAFEESL